MINLKSKLTRKGLVVIILPLLFELVFISVLAFLLFNAEQEFEERVQSKQIAITATGIVARLIDAELISMMYNAQQIPFLDVRFDEDATKINQSLEELRTASRDAGRPPEQFRRIDESVRMTLARLRRVFTNEIEADVDIEELVTTKTDQKRVYTVFTKALNEINSLLDAEQSRQEVVAAKEKFYRNALERSLTAGIAASVILSFGLAVFFAGGITGRLKIVLDNTRRLRAREPLSDPLGGDDEISQMDDLFHTAASDLTQIDEQRRHLVSLVREELSAPLAQVQFVLHNLSLGLYGELTPRAENRLTLASRDTDRVVRLLDDLLSIEDMQGAEFDLSIEQTDSEKLMTMAAGSVSDLAERNEVALEMLGKNVVFEADPDRIIQVLINLLSNAVKFSPKGGTVTIAVKEEDDQTVFYVSDQGRGIPEDKLDSIFEPFKQVSQSDQTDKGGTGLGLPICKKIANQHGGSIGVDSKEGEGSRFWLRVPTTHSDSATLE